MDPILQAASDAITIPKPAGPAELEPASSSKDANKVNVPTGGMATEESICRPACKAWEHCVQTLEGGMLPRCVPATIPGTLPVSRPSVHYDANAFRKGHGSVNARRHDSFANCDVMCTYPLRCDIDDKGVPLCMKPLADGYWPSIA